MAGSARIQTATQHLIAGVVVSAQLGDMLNVAGGRCSGTDVDKEDIGFMIFPNFSALHNPGFILDASLGAATESAFVSEIILQLLLSANGPQSSTRIARTIVQSGPALMPTSEMKAKGSRTFRAIFLRCTDLLNQHYNVEDPKGNVI